MKTHKIMKTPDHLPWAKPVLTAFLILALAGCDLFGAKDPEPGTVSIDVSNKIDGQDLVMNQAAYTSAAGHTYSVTLLEYIITDVALRKADGTLFQLESAHYCNAEDHDSHQVTPQEIPAGDYTAVAFTFGIEQDQNVFGNLANTAEFTNMMWPAMMPMGDGTTERYHYMRFEGRYGTDGSYRIHAGPSSGNDYSFDVELPLTMDVDGNDWEIEVAMNVDKWLDGPTVWDFDDYGFIMGNPAAQTLVQANGAAVFSIANTEAK